MLWLQNHTSSISPSSSTSSSSSSSSSRLIIHAILHDEQGPQRCTAIGRHAFSDDHGKTWTYAIDEAYNGTVQWAKEKGGGEGEAASDFYRRERPHVVLERGSGRPSHLSNGVQLSTASDRSWTLVQPLHV